MAALLAATMGKIRPIMVKGHERPLTMVKYNREGDLLFTCAKDHTPCLWYAENGERIGTYSGHCGAVWAVDVNFSSTRLLTGSADNSCKLWDVKTGECLQTWKHTAPVLTFDSLPLVLTPWMLLFVLLPNKRRLLTKLDALTRKLLGS